MTDKRDLCKFLGLRCPMPGLHHQVIAVSTPGIRILPIIGVKKTETRPTNKVLANEGGIRLAVFIAFNFLQFIRHSDHPTSQRLILSNPNCDSQSTFHHDVLNVAVLIKAHRYHILRHVAWKGEVEGVDAIIIIFSPMRTDLLQPYRADPTGRLVRGISDLLAFPQRGRWDRPYGTSPRYKSVYSLRQGLRLRKRTRCSWNSAEPSPAAATTFC
jgi:hypothetical protein